MWTDQSHGTSEEERTRVGAWRSAGRMPASLHPRMIDACMCMPQPLL